MDAPRKAAKVGSSAEEIEPRGGPDERVGLVLGVQPGVLLRGLRPRDVQDEAADEVPDTDPHRPEHELAGTRGSALGSS